MPVISYKKNQECAPRPAEEELAINCGKRKVSPAPVDSTPYCDRQKPTQRCIHDNNVSSVHAANKAAKAKATGSCSSSETGSNLGNSGRSNNSAAVSKGVSEGSHKAWLRGIAGVGGGILNGGWEDGNKQPVSKRRVYPNNNNNSDGVAASNNQGYAAAPPARTGPIRSSGRGETNAGQMYIQ